MKKIFLALIAVTIFVFLDSSANADESKIFVGKIEKSTPAFRYWWSFTAVADSGETKEFRVPKNGSTIIQIDGRQRYGEAPRAGRKIEVKYSVDKDGYNVTTSMRYVPPDYVQQSAPSTVSANVTSETMQPMQKTIVQTGSIFTGKVTNWKQVGGADLKIIPYSRESSSGTYEFFKEHIMLNKNYVSSILSMPATGSIIQSVSQTKGAIAYVGLAYLDKSVKELAVSFDGKTFVIPNEANAKNKTYPVIRPLFFYMDKKAAVQSKPLVDFIMSAEGQKIVEQVGYVPVK